MSGCDKIEALLWEQAFGIISEEDRELLRQHLADCPACRKIQSTIEALDDSRKSDEKTMSRVDADDFEAAVMQKIRAQERGLRVMREDKSYMIRMYFSVGLAAAIVAFMVFSMADLERFIIPSKPASYSRGAEVKKYDTFHIELQPRQAEVPLELPGLATAEKGEESPEKDMGKAAAPSPEETQPGFQESDVSKLFENKQEAENQPPELTPRMLVQIPKEKPGPVAEEEKSIEDTGAGLARKLQSATEKHRESATAYRLGIENAKNVAESGDRFQILNQPVTNPAPDSVAINSIYLMDQSIPLASQQMRAYLPEVIVDSGTIQSVETPRSVLVTVEKMPIPVKIIPPEYPVWARKNGISGTVWVKAHINENGDVISAEIASSSNPGYGFEKSSLEAAKQCKYLPAEANGYRIGVWVIYPVNFVFNAENTK